VDNDRREAVPAAMHLFIERYPHLDSQSNLDAEFIWFIATAPDSETAGYAVSKERYMKKNGFRIEISGYIAAVE
jgi:hypothetical protein